MLNEETPGNEIDEGLKESEQAEEIPEDTLPDVTQDHHLEEECTSLLRQIMESVASSSESITAINGQNAFLRQQLTLLIDSVYAQNSRVENMEKSVKKEFARFQTEGSHRIMGGILHKLFRDLVVHIGELDQMISLMEQVTTLDSDWIDSIRLIRERMEETFKDWGCMPVHIIVGEQEFNPDIHEAVAPEAGEIPETASENVVVAIRQRGWKMNETIIVHPKVVVA